jgi:HEAT repeat protein
MKQLGSHSVTSIIRVLNGTTSTARIPAIWALGEIGDIRAVPYLVRILEHDPSRFNRMIAAAALLKIDDPVGLEKVKQEFRESGPKDAKNPADSHGK